MKRRNLIQAVLLGLVGGSLGVRAAESGGVPTKDPMAGGVFYTRDKPGRWNRKVDSHLPIVELGRGMDGRTEVEVVTRHAITGYRHYIVKHVLLDQDFNFIAEHLFDPMRNDQAVSRFVLERPPGTLHVLSVCNRHDTWLSSIPV